jgi:hypothetical protein
MKNRIITIGIALVMAASFSSCKKEDTKPTPSPTAAAEINGKWKANYELNGVDSKFFDAYTFAFRNDGTISASGNGKVVVGKWSRNPVDEKPGMQLDFGTADPFSLLNANNWRILNENDTLIEMTGKRGDDGTHTLKFSK